MDPEHCPLDESDRMRVANMMENGEFCSTFSFGQGVIIFFH